MKEQNKSKSKKIILTTLSILLTILFLISCCILTFNIIYTKSEVKGSSMCTTMYAGDRVFINKFRKGGVGDIVVANISNEENWNHEMEGEYIIKRFVATEGDRVKIESNGNNTYTLLVNSKVFYKKQIVGGCPTYQNFIHYVADNLYDDERIVDGEVIVKDGEIFLIGDNWDTSYDCATVGPIKKSSLVGRVDIIASKNTNIVWGIVKGIFKMWFK